MLNFKGKNALVTGGLRGLGEVICRAFAACGGKVFVDAIS